MTAQIPLSEINRLGATVEQFGAGVERFVQALRDHRFTTGKPAPFAEPTIEAAVRRVPASEPGQPDDFVADYVVIDDLPPPPAPPTLAERKRAIIAKVREAEYTVSQAVLPLGKQRLADLDWLRISGIDEDRRSPEDVARLAQINRKRAAVRTIEVTAAHIESDIEDATDGTIAAVEASFEGDLSHLFQ